MSRTSVGILNLMVGARAARRMNLGQIQTYTGTGQHMAIIDAIGQVDEREIGQTYKDAFALKILKDIGGSVSIWKGKKFDIKMIQ
jgi:butyrate kinase